MVLPRETKILIPLYSRDNGVKAIENLMKKKGKFDYVLLETTGLADPGPMMMNCAVIYILMVML